MTSTDPKHLDEPVEKFPHPMPPSPDLHMVGTPIDSTGLPNRPQTTGPLDHEARSSTLAQIGGIAVILVVVLGIALLVWLVL